MGLKGSTEFSSPRRLTRSATGPRLASSRSSAWRWQFPPGSVLCAPPRPKRNAHELPECFDPAAAPTVCARTSERLPLRFAIHFVQPTSPSFTMEISTIGRPRNIGWLRAASTRPCVSEVLTIWLAASRSEAPKVAVGFSPRSHVQNQPCVAERRLSRKSPVGFARRGQVAGAPASGPARTRSQPQHAGPEALVSTQLPSLHEKRVGKGPGRVESLGKQASSPQPLLLPAPGGGGRKALKTGGFPLV